MSHQTGIQANQELSHFFGKCKDGSVRVFKVAIQNEELILDKFLPPKGKWDDDYDSMVLPLVEDGQPCYVFFRLDSRDQGTYNWVFIGWSPDNSQVRQKMLYASTKATLKKEFGGAQISAELFGNVKEDISLRGYRKYLTSEKAPAPLTFAEEELQSIKRSEALNEVSVNSKHQTLRGIEFPITDDAIGALFDLKEGLYTYVQLSINIDKEEIHFESKDNVSVTSLASKVPKDRARYSLFLFPHTHEGDHLKSIVFIYSIPDSKCPIKERMLYSSCKQPLLEVIENRIGIEIAKKVEIDDPSDLTSGYLYDQLHPKQNLCNPKFSKPKPPGNMRRRLIKGNKPDEPDDQE